MTRVLVVEDEESFSDAISYMLRKEGFEVAVCATGPDALDTFDRTGADLVLLDLMLPGDLSGTQVLERIRADHGAGPKVLVVSALVNASTAPKLEAYGNVQTLAKPFKIKELASRIQAMLAS